MFVAKVMGILEQEEEERGSDMELYIWSCLVSNSRWRKPVDIIYVWNLWIDKVI